MLLYKRSDFITNTTVFIYLNAIQKVDNCSFYVMHETLIKLTMVL